MFLPPKLTAIALNSLIALSCVVLPATAKAQQGEYDRRMAAMQQARARAQAPRAAAVQDAQYEYEQETAARAPAQVVQTQAQMPVQRATQYARPATQMSSSGRSSRPVARTAQAVGAVPRTQYGRSGQQISATRTRSAQLMGQPIIDGGAPIVGGMMVDGGVMMDGPVVDYGQGQIIGGGYTGQVVDGSYGGQVFMGDAASCGESGGYFDDTCCDRGGCPPGPCWLTGLGTALYNGNYFGGATSFRSSLFAAPGGQAGALANDCSHGFYGGLNLGIPLCKLTCGVFSGQFGVRSVQTNFNGSESTGDNRDQLFITTGFYRRVDYGLQIGVVADILHEEWFTESDLIQIRGDLGYVYGSGSTFGFRFATNVQDDVNAGTFNGQLFDGLIQATEDTYRFYYRHEAQTGGFGEAFVGWTDSNQTILGLDFDLPVADRVAMQAGFTYFLNDDGLPTGSNFAGGNAAEAYNIFVGLAFRPRGRSYYRSYDRPLFDVADNGTMLITRQ